MTADNRTLPGALRGPSRVIVAPWVVAAFQQNQQAQEHPQTGALLGTWSPDGHQIQVIEAVPWVGLEKGATVPAHPFTVDHAALRSRRDILNRQEQVTYGPICGLQPRQPIVTLGYWLVMPSVPLAPGEDIVDAMRQARGRELALLEHAVEAGWLRGTRLITAVREEWGKTRVRAYVVSPGIPPYQVMFKPNATTSPAVRQPAETSGAPVRRDIH